MTTTQNLLSCAAQYAVFGFEIYDGSNPPLVKWKGRGFSCSGASFQTPNSTPKSRMLTKYEPFNPKKGEGEVLYNAQGIKLRTDEDPKKPPKRVPPSYDAALAMAQALV